MIVQLLSSLLIYFLPVTLCVYRHNFMILCDELFSVYSFMSYIYLTMSNL